MQSSDPQDSTPQNNSSSDQLESIEIESPADGPSTDPKSVNPYLASPAPPAVPQPSRRSGELAIGAPRIWPSLLVTAVALFLCIAASSVMLLLAMYLVTGDMNPRQLVEPGFVAKLMASRVGFALLVIPPQIALLGCAVGAAILSPVRFRERLSLVRGRWPIWAWFAAGAAAPLVGLITSVFLGMFMTESENLKMMSEVFRDHSSSGFLIPLALMIGVTPAICEEMLFRGYVQTRLTRALPPWTGIFIASFLFAAFHMDPVHSTAVFPLGLFLGFVVWRSGSLFPAIIAHFVNNVISVVGVAFAPADKTDVLALPVAMVSLLILTTGMIGVAAIVFATIHYGKPPTTVAMTTQK